MPFSAFAIAVSRSSGESFVPSADALPSGAAYSFFKYCESVTPLNDVYAPENAVLVLS